MAGWASLIQAPTSVWGVMLDVCCAWYVPLSLNRDSWRLMKLISVCFSVLSYTGRWAHKVRESSRKLWVQVSSQNTQIIYNEVLVSLSPGKGIQAEGTLVDIETERQSRSKVLLTTEKVSRFYYRFMTVSLPPWCSLHAGKGYCYSSL